MAKRRLQRLEKSGRFHFQTISVDRGEGGSELIVRVSLDPGKTCDPRAIEALADEVTTQLTRPGDLGFHRVVDATESGLRRAMKDFAPGAPHDDGQALVVSSAHRAGLVSHLAARPPPPGVRYLVGHGGGAVESTVGVWAMEATPALTGAEVAEAVVKFEETTGQPQVLLKFTDEGAQRFGVLSTERVGKLLGIVFEGGVMSAPTVMEPILGGQAVISLGGGSRQDVLAEAQELAAILGAGALSAKLEGVALEATCPAQPAP